MNKISKIFNKLNKKYFTSLIISLILLLTISVGILLLKASKTSNLDNNVSVKQKIAATPTITIASIGTEEEDFLETEFNQAPKTKEYTYTLSSGKTVTIRLPEDVDPPLLPVVEEMEQKRNTLSQ